MLDSPKPKSGTKKILEAQKRRGVPPNGTETFSRGNEPSQSGLAGFPETIPGKMNLAV
jgi:hypothetical protein